MKGKRTLEISVGIYTLLSLSALIVGKVGSPILVAACFVSVAARVAGLNLTEKFTLTRIPDSLGAFLITLLILARMMMGTDLLSAFVEGLLIFQAVKWLFLDTPRNAFILAGIAYMEVIASASNTTSIQFFPIFVTVTLLTSIVLFLLYIQAETTVGSDKYHRSIPVRKGFLTIIGGFGLLSLLITTLIFLALPRLGIGFFGYRGSDIEDESAFTSRVTLKERAFSLEDGRVIARLKSETPLTPPLYLRAVTLSTFRNDTWLKEGGKHPIKSSGRWNYLLARRALTRTVNAEIIQEPTGLTGLLIPINCLEVKWKWGRLMADSEGNVFSPLPLMSPVKYRVTIGGFTVLSEKKLDTYRARSGTPAIVSELAKNLGLSALDPPRQVETIRRYLARRCTYERSPNLVSLEEFLSGKRAGNCQHYATVTVLLLREGGTPARFAGGYASSEYNNLGEYWMFRKKDAHAWAEMYVKGKGWVPVDTTPAASLSEIPVATSHFFDWFREMWFEYVIGYDLEKQVKISKNILRRSVRVGKALKEKKELSVKIAIFLLIFGGVAAAGRLGLAKGLFKLTKRKEHPVYLAYLKPVQAEGKKRGIPSVSGETPREYLTRLAASGFVPERLAEAFSDVYEKARYGVAPTPPPPELEDLKNRLISILKG